MLICHVVAILLNICFQRVCIKMHVIVYFGFQNCYNVKTENSGYSLLRQSYGMLTFFGGRCNKIFFPVKNCKHVIMTRVFMHEIKW